MTGKRSRRRIVHARGLFPRAGCFVLLATLALPIGSSHAAIESGVEFPERVRTGGSTLDLCATALLRYKIIFKGYAGALYLSDCEGRSDRALGDVPKRLELSYFWSIQGTWIAEAAEELLAQSLSPATLASLRDRLDRLHAAYVNVEPGDRYSLSYVPGMGTELALNGRPIITIEGADFAEAYFGIWLGPDPLSADFRDALLS